MPIPACGFGRASESESETNGGQGLLQDSSSSRLPTTMTTMYLHSSNARSLARLPIVVVNYSLCSSNLSILIDH